MYTGMLHTHKLVVSLFLLIYLIKTIMLLSGNNEKLDGFTKKVKVPEMIISVLFLLTGIVLAVNSGDIGAWFWFKIAAVALSIPLAVVGFKKKSKMLAFLSLFLLIYAYGVSETRAPFFKKETIEVSSTEVSGMGAEIYSLACMNCHGADGKLGRSGAKDLTLSTLSHEEKVALVGKGKNGMPGFHSQLKPLQIEAVVNYVESLKKKH
jgi:mono/diheme cytochrome c family protein